MKRRAVEAALVDEQNTKRTRYTQSDRLSLLTDELTLRIFSYLTPAQLCDCQRLSHRLRVLASDSSLWREHYFQRFVRPRSSRLPGIRDRSTGKLCLPSPAAKWLDEQHLIDHAAKTDWKKQYKLKHNWSCGACSVDEILLDGDQRGMVVDMRHGVIFTADRERGLRAWSTQGSKRMIAEQAFDNDTSSNPTAICIDIRSHTGSKLRLCVGFADGSFQASTFDEIHGFTIICCHGSKHDVAVTAMSMAWPLTMALSTTQRLQIYDLSNHDSGQATLVHSVQASKPYWPTAVSLRDVAGQLLVSIAYVEPTYYSGCTAGIQEIRFSDEGQFIGSRTATAIPYSHHSIALKLPRSPSSSNLSRHEELTSFSKPISLSYTHPYLLVSRADRTLTLYMVTSTPKSLSISNGRTLWGHTSSVSGAHIGKRGKAVSASKRGDELLIWELEGETSQSARKQPLYEEKGVVAKPGNVAPSIPSQQGLPLHLPNKDAYDGLVSGGWLGFDAENAVVLREDLHGRQVLVIYDFT